MTLRFITILAVIGFITGCTGQEIRPQESGSSPEGFATWSEAVPSFTLGPGDRVSVNYLKTPEMNEDLLVRPDGMVNVQTAGSLRAADLQPEELADQIANASTSFLRDPIVSVSLTEAESARIFVGGEVESPGAFQIGGRVGAVEAVLLAGDFTRDARIRNVVLIRRGPHNTPMLRTVDLGGFIEGSFADDVPLYPGDILFVPRSGIAEVNMWIDQFINRVVPFNRAFSYTTNREL